MDGTFEWVVVILAAALVVAMVTFALLTTVRSRRLRERFGPEYERAVEQADGDRRRAESELKGRLVRHRALTLRPLSPAARGRYQRQWKEAQAGFVDAPAEAVEHAQLLVNGLMTERGYPDGDDGVERLDLVSVEHPQSVERYRKAQALHDGIGASADTATATEDRRQALLHYKAVLTSLLGSGDGQETGRANETEPARQESEEEAA